MQVTCSLVQGPLWSWLRGKSEKEEKKTNEAAPSPCSCAFSCRLCACAPFTNAELEIWMWVQYSRMAMAYDKLSCKMKYLLQNLLEATFNFVSSFFGDVVNLLSTAGLWIVIVVLLPQTSLQCNTAIVRCQNADCVGFEEAPTSNATRSRSSYTNKRRQPHVATLDA